MLVSIIIPVHNTQKLCRSAVHSILHQTYPNIEIIIIDDCSTDESFQILSQLASQHSNIKLLQNKVNQGTYYCRSHTGQYCENHNFD